LSSLVELDTFQQIVNVNFGGPDILAIYADILTDSTVEGGAPPPAIPVTFNLTIDGIGSTINFMASPTLPTGGPSMIGASATTPEMRSFYTVWSYPRYEDFTTDTAEAADVYVIEPDVEGAWLGPGYQAVHESEGAASAYIDQWRAANPEFAGVGWFTTFSPGFVASTRQDVYGLLTFVDIPKTRAQDFTVPSIMRIELDCPTVNTAGLGVIQGNIRLTTTRNPTLEADEFRAPVWDNGLDVDSKEYQLFQFIDDNPVPKPNKRYDIDRAELTITDVT
jgi:hypothetical protein